MAEAFFRLFPWNFKEKGISHFLWHSLSFYRGQPSSESEPPRAGSTILCGWMIWKPNQAEAHMVICENRVCPESPAVLSGGGLSR